MDSPFSSLLNSSTNPLDNLLSQLPQDKHPLLLSFYNLYKNNQLTSQQFMQKAQALFTSSLRSKLSAEKSASSAMDSSSQDKLPTDKTDTSKSNDKQDKMDVDSMMDAASYAGIDLKQEEYQPVLPSKPRKTQVAQESPFLNQTKLKKVISDLVSEQDIQNVDVKVLDFISQATKAYLSKILTSMIAISRHRSGAVSKEFLASEKALGASVSFQGQSKDKKVLYTF